MVLCSAAWDTAQQMVAMPTLEQFTALQQALAEARQHNDALAGELRTTTGELRIVRTERDLLKEQLNKFKRQLFAASSEVTGQHQKDMFFNEAERLGAQAEPAGEETASDDDKIDVPGHRRTKRGRKPLDPALPREVVRHELPVGERVCPLDGAALREIGVEASEQLDIIPQQVRVIRHERVKYACPCCDGGLRLAARPAQVIPKGLFTESALAWMATTKYLDGLPLYRQAALLCRFGGTDISRNTVAASMVRVGQAVQPVMNLLRDELLPRATLLTPNVPEAEALLGRRIRDLKDMEPAARQLLQLGPQAVLLKGGHMRGSEVVDLYLDAHGGREFRAPRQRFNGHGTGCTLASLCAARLALGELRAIAVENAILAFRRALASGVSVGQAGVYVPYPLRQA